MYYAYISGYSSCEEGVIARWFMTERMTGKPQQRWISVSPNKLIPGGNS